MWLSLFCTESEGGAGGHKACVISRLVRYSVALQRLLALPASSTLLCMPCSCKNANRAWLAYVVSYFFSLPYLAHVPQDFSFWFLWHFITTDATISTNILLSLYAVILIFFFFWLWLCKITQTFKNHFLFCGAVHWELRVKLSALKLALERFLQGMLCSVTLVMSQCYCEEAHAEWHRGWSKPIIIFFQQTSLQERKHTF